MARDEVRHARGLRHGLAPFLGSSVFSCVQPNAQSMTTRPRTTFQIVITESCVIENAATAPVPAGT